MPAPKATVIARAVQRPQARVGDAAAEDPEVPAVTRTADGLGEALDESARHGRETLAACRVPAAAGVSRQAALFLLGTLAGAAVAAPAGALARRTARGRGPAAGSCWRAGACWRASRCGLGWCLLHLAELRGRAAAAGRGGAAPARLRASRRCRRRRAPTTQFDARCTPVRGAGLRACASRFAGRDAAPLRVGETWQTAGAAAGAARTGQPGLGGQLAGPAPAAPARRWRACWPRRSTRAVPPARWSIDRLRERIAADIARAVPERDAAALLAALAVGDTGACPASSGACSTPPASRTWSRSPACT